MESLEINKNLTLDEIVFEQRNKGYGAYPLRKKYDRTVLLALLFASMAFAAALLIPLVNTLLAEEPAPEPPPKKKTEVPIIDIPLDPKTPPPPPLPPIEPPQVKTVKFVPPEIVDDKDAEDPPPSQKDLEKEIASDKDRKGEENPDAELPPDIPTGKVGGLGDTESDEPWAGPITKDVAFGGGHIPYIQKNVSDKLRHYIAERGIKGRIMFVVTIGKDGAVKSAEVMQGREIPNCKICSEEILGIIKSMPKWTPAENNGVPVIRKISITVVI